MAGNLVLGALADRAGHLVSLGIGAGALLLANVVALLAPSLELFIVVFALQGVQLAAVNVSGLNVLLEFAPEPGRAAHLRGARHHPADAGGLRRPAHGRAHGRRPRLPGGLRGGGAGRAWPALALLLGRVREPRIGPPAQADRPVPGRDIFGGREPAESNREF